jgi:hypothetical protein
MNLDLMIARSQINLREYLSFRQLIKQDVTVGKRIFVLDGDGIEWTIIHAHAQRLILLLHKDSRTIPRRRARMNQTLLQKLIQLGLELG